MFLPTLPEAFIKNPNFEGLIVREGFSPGELPGDLHSLFYEYEVSINHAHTSVKVIAGAVDRVTFVVCCSQGTGAGWPWMDVVAIASSQAKRIEESIC